MSIEAGENKPPSIISRLKELVSKLPQFVRQTPKSPVPTNESEGGKIKLTPINRCDDENRATRGPFGTV